MRFKINARRFSGEASITCYRCSHLISLPNDAMVILFDDGSKSFIVSAIDRSIMHRCGRKMHWVCAQCGNEAEPVHRRRRKGGPTLDLRCRDCWGGYLVQREVPIEGLKAIIKAAAP